MAFVRSTVRQQALSAVGGNPQRAAGGVAVTVLAAWTAVIVGVGPGHVILDSELVALARTASAALFLAAGVLLLCRAWLTGQARDAWNATAALVFALAPVVGMLGPLLQARPVFGRPISAGRLLLTAVVLALVATAHRLPSPARRSWPPALIGVALIGCVATSAALARAVYLQPAGSALSDRIGWFATELAATIAWLLFAAGARARRHAGFGAGWVVLAALALGEALRAWTALAPGTAWLLGTSAAPGTAAMLATGCELAAAAVLAVAVVRTVPSALASHGAQTARLNADLDRARQELQQHVQHERERLHDARAAVAGLAGASRLLTEPDGVRELDRARLARLMRAELHRLDQALVPVAARTAAPFELAATLEPVLFAHRLAGGRVEARLGGLWAHGNPEQTATAVANLLTNVRLHAPGATAVVRATARSQSVELRVEDDGPGIPVDERSIVVLPGARGASTKAAGSGLGLATAATAMAVQGGSLHVEERGGGGAAVVLTLPAEPAELPAAAPAALRASGRGGLRAAEPIGLPAAEPLMAAGA